MSVYQRVCLCKASAPQTQTVSHCVSRAQYKCVWGATQCVCPVRRCGRLRPRGMTCSHVWTAWQVRIRVACLTVACHGNMADMYAM